MIKINRPECPSPNKLKVDYKFHENKKSLKEASFDKCMYCESKISHNSYGDVEHIKPKSKYPQLEFTWSNLGFACSVCNNNKNNQYDADNPILSPYEEDPEQHLFACGNMIYHHSEKGELTCQTIQLNRAQLVEKRLERINSIKNSYDKFNRTNNARVKRIALEALKKEGNPDKEYSACVQSFFKSAEISQ